MKTTLAILLSISLTCNAFLLFLIHQRPPTPPGAAATGQSASGVSQAEYDRVNGLYQKDEERIAAVKQRLPIFCVIIQAGLLEEKYRGVFLNRYLASIDTSKCPMDFQQAWLAYVQEKRENQRQQSARFPVIARMP